MEVGDRPLDAAGVVVAEVAGWEAVTASVRGSTHVRKGAPNQDAVMARASSDGALLVTAVADGHGGARYVRSEIGSRSAVRLATAHGLEAPLGVSGRALLRWGREVFIPQVVAAWRAEVEGHAAAHPFTPSERAGLGSGSDPAIAYGSTLLVSINSVQGALITQLGDGDAIVVPGEGPARLAVAGDERNIGGATTSLCLPSAIGDTRAAFAADAELVVLASDGYGTSFADPDWRDRLARDLREQDLTAQRLRSTLPGWLAESARVGGDDVTVALCIRRARRRRGAKVGRATRRRRIVLVAAASLAAGAVGGWAGASATDGRPSADDAAPEGAIQATAGTTTEATGATTTTAAATTGPAGGPAPAAVAWIVATDAAVVEFVADPGDPRPFRRASGGSVPAATSLWASGGEWRITGNVLQVTGVEGRVPRAVPTPGLTPGGLAYAGGFVWVVDARASAIAAVDPTTRQVVAGPVPVSEEQAGSVPAGGGAPTVTTQGSGSG